MSKIRKGGKHSNSNIETHTTLIKREEYTGWTPIHAAQVTFGSPEGPEETREREFIQLKVNLVSCQRFPWHQHYIVQCQECCINNAFGILRLQSIRKTEESSHHKPYCVAGR